MSFKSTLETISAPDDQPEPGEMTVFAPPSFDYSGLQPSDAEQLRKAASEIKKELTTERQTMLRVGQHLNEVKHCLKHGDFMRWLEAEFRMEDRYARYAMSLARFVAKLSPEESEVLSDLPDTAMIKLSAPGVPKAVVDNVISRLRAGERPRVADIDLLVGEAKRPPEPKATKAAELTRPTVEAAPPETSSSDNEAMLPVTTERTPEGPVTAPVSSVDVLLSALPEMVALTDVQRQKNPLGTDLFEHATECLQKLVAATGDYSLIAELAALAHKPGGALTLVHLLLNFPIHQAHASGLAEGTREERLAA